MIRFINDKQKHKMGIYDDEIYYIILPNEPVGGEKEEVEVWQSNNNGRDIKVKNITLADVFSR